MNVQSLALFLLIGLAAGWIAGQVLKTGFNLVVTLIVGVVGAVLGGWLFGVLGLGPTNLLGSLISATVGAILFVLALTYVKKKL